MLKLSCKRPMSLNPDYIKERPGYLHNQKSFQGFTEEEAVSNSEYFQCLKRTSPFILKSALGWAGSSIWVLLTRHPIPQCPVSITCATFPAPYLLLLQPILYGTNLPIQLRQKLSQLFSVPIKYQGFFSKTNSSQNLASQNDTLKGVIFSLSCKQDKSQGPLNLKQYFLWSHFLNYLKLKEINTLN